MTLQQPILRAKGFASIEGKRHRLVVQAVRNRVQTYFEQQQSDESHSTLVVIGYHPRRDQITTLDERINKFRMELVHRLRKHLESTQLRLVPF